MRDFRRTAKLLVSKYALKSCVIEVLRKGGSSPDNFTSWMKPQVLEELRKVAESLISYVSKDPAVNTVWAMPQSLMKRRLNPAERMRAYSCEVLGNSKPRDVQATTCACLLTQSSERYFWFMTTFVVVFFSSAGFCSVFTALWDNFLRLVPCYDIFDMFVG